ncbi:hypothetical protein [Actinokineospora enzanensis]|uniref:phage terminase small subunit n=1 Tax=Actinokineospora enzanensis TaxID=155975 RepID=UPI00037F64B7|nr:hypothetical protein [Actinokineospora enzanensis]
MLVPLAGRTPSANPRNRNAKTYDWTTVENTAYDGPSPELPAKGGRQRWHRETRAWWDAVRRMPHCRLWSDTDWRFAIETAVLVEAFWRDHPSVAAELRLRSAKLGLTHEDRLKLRIRYVDPDDGEQVSTQAPAAVARLDERRKRLAGDDAP